MHRVNSPLSSQCAVLYAWTQISHGTLKTSKRSRMIEITIQYGLAVIPDDLSFVQMHALNLHKTQQLVLSRACTRSRSVLHRKYWHGLHLQSADSETVCQHIDFREKHANTKLGVHAENIDACKALVSSPCCTDGDM